MSGGYNLGTASGRIEIDGSGVDKGFAVARAAVGAFKESIERQRDQMEQYGKDMTRNAIVGATGFAIASKSAAGFEKQLSAIRAVSGASEADMRMVAAAALEIGANSAFSASEAAKAFEELIKAGIPLEEALNGAAKATVDLAAAGEIALPRAAEIAANSMNNFNKTGKDMPKIADVIAGAANASAISVEEFAQSLSQVGAVANLTGMSFEDTAVAIAEMGNAGIKGSDAGTSLKTMLMNLIPTMDNQVAKFEEMGLMTFSADKAMRAMAKSGIPAIGDSLLETRQAVSDYLEATQGIPDDTKEMGKAVDEWLMKNGAMQNAFFTTEGNVKSLSEIQEVLQQSTKDMTREQKLNSLEIMFGADAIRGAAVMADNGAEGYNKLALAMSKVTASDTANMRMDNLAGDLEALRGAWETLTIRLGEVFLPVLREIVQFVTKVVQFFADATDAGMEMMSKWLVFKTIGMGVTGVIITLISQLGGLLAVLIGVRTAFGFVNAFKAAIAVLASGGGIIKALSMLFTETIRGSWLFRAAFKALEVVFVRFLGFGALGAVFTGIGAGISAGLGPVAIAVGAFKSLGAALVLIGGRFLSLLTGVNRVAGVFTLLGGSVGLAIRIILGLITAGRLLYGTWEPFRNLVDGIVAAIKDGFNVSLAVAKDVIDGFMAGLNGTASAGSDVSNTFVEVGKAAQGLMGWLKQIWDGIVANVVPAFESFLAILQGSFGTALTNLGNTISTTLWPALQELGRVLVEELWPALVTLAEAMWPIIQVVGIVAGVIIGVLFFAFVKITEFVLGVFIPALLFVFGHVFGFIITVVGKLIEVFAMLLVPIVWLATFLFGTLIPAIIEFAAVLINNMVTAVTVVIQAIQNVIKWFQELPQTVADINSTVNGFFDGIGQAIMDAFAGAIGFVEDVFENIGNAIQTYIGWWVSIIMGIVAFWRPVWEPFLAIVVAIFDVIMAVVNGFVGLFVKLFQFGFGLVSLVIQVFIAYVVARWNEFWNGLMFIVNFIVNLVVAKWTEFTTFVSAIFAVFSAYITAQWNAFWAGLQAILQPVIDWFNNTIGAWWNSMFGQTQGGSSAVTGVFDGFWKTVQDIFNVALAFIVNYVKGRFQEWQNIIGGAMNWARSIMDGFWSWVRSVFQGAMGWLNDITGGGFNRLVQIIQVAMAMIPQYIQNKFNEALAFMRGIPGSIQSIFNGAVNWLGDIGGKIIEGLLGGLRAAAGNVQSFFQGLTDMIPEWKGPYKRDKVLLKPAGQAIMGSLTDGFQDEMRDFYRMLDNMNVDIPLALSATLNPSIPSLEGSLAGYPVNSTNILKGPDDGKIALTPKFDVAVKIGDRDITDMVDVRITEQFDEVSSLIGTGVNS